MDFIYIINLFLQMAFETTFERTVNNPSGPPYKNDIETGLYYKDRPLEWRIDVRSEQVYKPLCEV
jgi:hypothetical protein